MGDILFVYLESKDIQKTFMAFEPLEDPLEIWFIEEMKKKYVCRF